MLSKERGKMFQEKWDEMEYRFANMEMKQQIDQLTRNWNELEEWVKNDKEKAMVNFECGRCFNMFDILDKMKEIKECNNVSSRD